jgi:GT2 family glycosyltransferase
VEAIRSREDDGRVWAVVFFHDAPVGIVELKVVGGECSSDTVRRAIVAELGDRLLTHTVANALATGRFSELTTLDALLHADQTAPSASIPTVTVAVCTHRRPDDLSRCLAALDRQDYPSLERLVVDNAPDDPRVRALVENEYPGVRYVAEPRPGLSWARNRAILETRGDILAFTDDDAIADPGWVRALVQPFESAPDVALTAGLVVPIEVETEAQYLFERHGGLGRGFEPRWLRAPRAKTVAGSCNVSIFGVGANFAIRRSVLDEIGGFDPALGAGTRSAAGEELELFFRVLKAGYTLAYEPSALVRHRHRRELTTMRLQLGQWLAGWIAAMDRLKEQFPDERLALTMRVARLLFGYFPCRLSTSLLGSSLSLGLVLSEWRGALIGFQRYGVARREASAIAARFPAFPVLPYAHRSSVAHPAQSPVHRLTIDVDRSLPALIPVADDVDRVLVTVTRAGQVVGRVRLLAGGAPIERRRLAQTIAGTLGRQLVDTRAFRRALVEALV